MSVNNLNTNIKIDKKSQRKAQREAKKLQKKENFFNKAMSIELKTISQIEKWDSNKDTKVGKDEVPTKMDSIFDKIDGSCNKKGRDGVLSFEELYLFNQFTDANKNGEVEEFEEKFAIKKIKYSDNPFNKLKDYEHKNIKNNKTEEFAEKAGKLGKVFSNFTRPVRIITD